MRRLMWAVLVCAAGGLVAAGPASAAPPPNDSFAAATTLPSATSVVITGSNVDATTEAGEPCCVSQSVWYRWTAPETGTYQVEVCGSSFNTNLQVFTGATVNALTSVAFNNDDPGCGDGTRSRLTFNAVQGQLYHLRVASPTSGTPGTISGSIALVPSPPPPPPAADTDPPDTGIISSVIRSESGKAKFRFTSDEAGATFECKLKGPDLKRKLRQFRACDSPRRYKGLDEGGFRFKVRAIDAAGNVDPTPDKKRFRVVD